MSNKLQGEAFSEIFYNSPVNMLIIDVDSPIYTILDVNNAYLSATNTTREDLIGKPVFEVVPGNPTDSDSKNIERSIYSFEQALETRLPHVMSNYRYDIPIAGTTEFEERYWTTSNTPVLDKDGEVLYIIHSPINVTELNKLSKREKVSIEAVRNQEEMLYNTFMHDQRQAKEEQSKLITLVDNSVDLMSILNLKGINTYINEAGKKMLGFESDEEVQSTHIAELHLPEDLEFVEKEVIPIVMKEGKWRGIINVRNKRTNEVFQVFNNCIRIDDPVSGEPIALGAVMRDLRPELASKQALADSEQLLRTITAASPPSGHFEICLRL